ncbi:hypothetical protein NUSPORA_02561 [Nucleospora cyclopteri]
MDNENYKTIDILFIDDLKLFTASNETRIAMVYEIKTFLNIFNFEINKAKSTTNSRACMKNARLLKRSQVYKYLRITKSSVIEVANESLKHIKSKMIKKIKRFLKTKINTKNLIKKN